MFNNKSGLLKTWAVISGILGSILALISGIALISVSEYLEFLGVLGFVIILFGILSSWLTALILFGLGCLMDNTYAIYSKVNKNTFDIERLSNSVQIVLNRAKEPKSDKEVLPGDNFNKAEPKPNTSADTVEVLTGNNGKVVCPKCNFEQDANRSCCWHCGAKFEKKDKPSSTHRWLCGSCGKMRTQTPCEHCGVK